MKLNFNTIEHIQRLRKADFTLTEIIADTGLSKSTIYPYIKNIPPTMQLKEKIKASRLKAQNTIAASRRGKSIKTYNFLKPDWNANLVNLIAHFLFDGEITRTSCAYNNRSQILIEEVIYNMEKELSVNDYKIYKNNLTGVMRVSYYNVEIAAYIRSKADQIFEHIVLSPQDEKLVFLKAFFDDEGSVTFRRKVRMVRGYQHSQKILEIIHKLLSGFGIKSSIDSRYFEIDIYRKENLVKFQKIINFTPGLCVNGKRSNSVWKKDLEKRKILEMAINSYKS